MTYPKHLYVYVCEYDKETPILAVAETLDEIPEDQDGEMIASYSRNFTTKIVIKKTLLSNRKQ